MAEAATLSNGESSTPGPKYHAPKDRKCKFCGVSFTSSSLGRHLDQFIKEKNPKVPDNIHHVDEIKKMREGITRRQPRNSMLGRRGSTLTPVSTPRAPSSAKEAEPLKPTAASSIPKGKEGQYAVDSILSKFPLTQGWEQTDVMTETPKTLDTGAGGAQGASRRANNQRRVSRQVLQKAQFDDRHKLEDAMDIARAAELSLRELLEAWRAAKQHIDGSSKPFDFDPLVLDFPALTLQCLRPPPTLFSLTTFPSPSSWSIQSPGSRELEGLKWYFKTEFKNWRMNCAAATTNADELIYPPKNDPGRDRKEDIKRAEMAADELERQIDEHLDSSYAAWESLPAGRRDEVWLLEMARSVGRKHKEVQSLKEEKALMSQKIAHLQLQIDQSNRQQQPREFKLTPPLTAPLGPREVTHMLELGFTQGLKAVGLSEDDRHVDLTTVVARTIERWKAVVVSQRRGTSNLGGQRSLPDSVLPVPPLSDNSSPNPTARHPLPTLQTKGQPPRRSQADSRKLRQIQPSTRHQQAHTRTSPPDPSRPKSESITSLQETGSEVHAAQSIRERPPSKGLDEEAEADADGGGEADGDDDSNGDSDGDGEGDGDRDADGDEDVMNDAPDLNPDEDDGMDHDDEDADGDEDADAEMEDDLSFQMMHATPAAAQEQVLQEEDMLHVPRTRGHAKEHVDTSFILRHSMPNMNASIHETMVQGVQGVHGDDTMYME